LTELQYIINYLAVMCSWQVNNRH